MQTLSQSKYLRAALGNERGRGRRIALVPTMGNLHEGHLQLVRHAHDIADIVVVSLFVNPMQFGADEDFDTYPRTISEDQQKLEAENTHFLYMPDLAEMYPNGVEAHTAITVPALDGILCGASRPIFFTGVCTVVCKLLNLVAPDVAIFGEKDFQQLTIIQRMVSDLCMPIEIVGVATARAHDGLALSSRNNYLTTVERARAPQLYQLLQTIRDNILAGEKNYTQLCADARQVLERAGFEVDYVEVRRQADLMLAQDDVEEHKLVVLAAAMLGTTRLIDNISITQKRLS